MAGASEVWVRGDDFACTSNRLAVGGRLIDVRTPGGAYGELLVPLHGAHQGDNASAAMAAVEAFFGSPLHEDVVEEALAAVRVPGRLEVIGRHPLVVVDGAHNVAGMLALARSLVEEFAVDGEAQAVVGMLSGRDPVAMLEALLDRRDPVGGGLRPRLPPRPAGRGGGRGRPRAGHGGRRGCHARPKRWDWPSAGPGPTTGWWCADRSTSWPRPGGCWSPTPPDRTAAPGRRRVGPVRRTGRDRAWTSLPRSWDEHW